MTSPIYIPSSRLRSVGPGWPTVWTGGFSSGSLIDLQRSFSLGSDDQLRDPFSQHVWVYACIAARARNIASTPFRLWSGESADAPELASGPLVDLLTKPHPIVGGAKLWELMSVFNDIDGEGYWLLHRKAGDEVVPLDAQLGDDIPVPDEICPVPGTAVTIKWDEASGLPESFHYGGRGEKREYPPGSVVPFIDVGHQNPLRAIGATEALRRRLRTDFAAETLDISAAENGGMPGMFWSSDEELSESQLDQIEARLEARQNSPNRHMKPALAHGGLKPLNVAWTPKDMENSAMRQFSLSAIMAAFGVTKPILGLTEGTNYASAREARRSFWEDTIIPQQERFARTVTESFLSRVRVARGRSQAVVGSFDVSEVEALGDTLDQKIERTERLRKMGVGFNKAAELAGWEIDPLTDADFDHPDPEEAGAGEEPHPRASEDRAIRAPQTAQARES